MQLNIAQGLRIETHLTFDDNILLVVTLGKGFSSDGNLIKRILVVLNSASAEKVNS